MNTMQTSSMRATIRLLWERSSNGKPVATWRSVPADLDAAAHAVTTNARSAISTILRRRGSGDEQARNDTALVA